MLFRSLVSPPAFCGRGPGRGFSSLGGVVHGSATCPRTDKNPIPPLTREDLGGGSPECSISKADYRGGRQAVENPFSTTCQISRRICKGGPQATLPLPANTCD